MIRMIVAVYVVLLVGGAAVLYFTANALEPGPVVSVLAGAVWAYVCGFAALGFGAWWVDR